jgi:hypothetical protein
MDEGELQRLRRREFIRTHHPDRGGDPAAFIAGLRQLQGQPAPPGPVPPPRVVVVQHRAWPVRLILALARRLGLSRRPPRVR